MTEKSYDQLNHEARARGLVQIGLPEPDQAVDATTFTFALNQNRNKSIQY